MDVRSMCSISPPSSDQSNQSKVSGFAPHVQSLPSPPLMDTVNEKKGSSLPPLTSILPPLHEINPPKQRRDTSSLNPESPHSQVNYPQPPVQSISQRSSLTSPPSSNDTGNSMWSRQPHPQPTTSYYHQPFPPPHPPPPQYPYAPQSQQQSVQHYPYPPPVTTAMYPPAYATSSAYSSSGNDLNGDDDDDSPYILQTAEQSLAKMGKAVDHCNQIAHFASRYRDMKMNYNNQWDGMFPQITESNLTDMINRAYDILNILSGLRGEITSRRSNASEIDLIRKQRILGTSTRTKYRKRSKRAAPPGRCHSCNISETPEWRRGPDGARTLCNACGLHFAKITRKHALSVMQQAEQQQQQAEQQQQQQQQQQVAFSPPLSKDNGDASDNSSSNNGNSSDSSMPTPAASDAERDSSSSHEKQPSIEVIDD